MLFHFKTSRYSLLLVAGFLVPFIVLVLRHAIPLCGLYLSQIRAHFSFPSDFEKMKSMNLDMSDIAKKTFFQRLQTFRTDYSPCTITQYESERTGMRAVVVDRKGPKVRGFFTLATEIHDDSGAPHTLEHLVFMGSKNYKYKGVLDRIATRAYSVTNAWTATDHTAYTLDTAGWESFAQILPVYLEHVLLPTLTDAGCYTEVHHVDGTGNDAGVVYSEMQGVQNNQDELMGLRAKRLLYPEGVGFRYETGGMLEQLRVLTADRIRAFHKEMYQPKNLCLVIIGEVDHGDLLGVLDRFETSILDEVPKIGDPWKRPWVESTQPSPLKKSVTERVEFPEDDESTGEISVSFFGPNGNDTLLTSALGVLITYLSGSSVSVLENTLVEKEQLASGVYFNIEWRLNSVISFAISGVETEKLEYVEKRFFEVLQDTASKPLDMAYMLECVKRQKRQTKSLAENSGYFFSDPIISDHLFGNRDGSTLRDLETLKEYDDLEKWDDQQWRSFLKQWISDAPHITILGHPSKKLSKKLKADEKARVAKQKKELGENGLKELEKRLEEAKASNDVEIPRSLLEKFKIPGTDSIHFIETTAARSGLARKMGPLNNKVQKSIDQDGPDLPLFIHFESIPSNFVLIYLIICTGKIPVQERPLVAIYLTNFFNTPITRNGSRIEFEKVVIELEKDTVSYTVDASLPELIRIKFEVEPEKYEAAIRWVRTMLWDGIFDEMRLKATVTKMMADIPDEKRNGNNMLSAVDTMVHYAPESIARAQNTLVKALYLKRINRLLKEEPETVIAMLNKFRGYLCTLENLRILVAGDIEKLRSPVSAWKGLIDGHETSGPLSPIDKPSGRLSEAGRRPGGLAYVVPMPTLDSSFSMQTAKGPDSYDHEQLPALLVAVAYLDAVEGPLWCAVRGTGLAYGTGFHRDIDAGHLSFYIYRSPDAYKAFMASKKTIEDHVSGATPFDPLALEGAISSIVVQFANEQASMSTAAQMSFVNQVLRGLSPEYSSEILKKVRDLGVDDIKAVLEKVVLPVFEPATANLVVTCAYIMKEGLLENFNGVGFNAQVKPLDFFHDDYGLKPKDGDEETEVEEEEEEESGSEGSDGDIEEGREKEL